MLSGKASVRVGGRTADVVAGDPVFAPAGVEHGVVAALERTVMVVGMTRQALPRCNQCAVRCV